MKKFFTLMAIILPGIVFGQKSAIIDTLFVSGSQTTTLIFPEDVALFDIGSEDFGGMKNTNLLLLKAVSEDASPTNILVKYGDNIFHGTICYARRPKVTFIDFRNTQSTGLPNSARINRQDSIKNLEKQMAIKRLNVLMTDKHINYRTISVRLAQEQIGLALTNMTTDSDIVYLKFLFVNGSKLDYVIDFAEFIYRDPVSNKDLKGAYDKKNVYMITQSDINQIDAKKEQFIGYAIPRYALSKRGELQFILREKTGSRVIELLIPFSEILTARSINQ